MTIACRLPANAIHNIRDQFQWKSFAWIKPELEKLKKHWLLLVCLIPVSVTLQILYDVDYDGHDVTARGIRIFTWLPHLMGKKATAYVDDRRETDDIFPHGLASLDPLCIKQQGLMDCKFLAAVSSLIRTEKGKSRLYKMIKQNADDSVTVTFPGVYSTPVTVSKLTPEEKHYYSKTSGVEGEFDGQWLPLLEKAYGKYRVEHQDLWKTTLRYIKHVVLDFRFTDSPALSGFGASYGASDEIGAQVLSGGQTRNIETSSFELGSFGLGKGHVTWRQLRSWFNRDAAAREIENEQNAALIDAISRGSIVVASTEINGDARAYHLFSGHAYAVLDYDAKTRTLTLKDPLCADMWDFNTHRSRDGKEDGLFDISLHDFNQLFSRLRVQVNERNQ